MDEIAVAPFGRDGSHLRFSARQARLTNPLFIIGCDDGFPHVPSERYSPSTRLVGL